VEKDASLQNPQTAGDGEKRYIGKRKGAMSALKFLGVKIEFTGKLTLNSGGPTGGLPNKQKFDTVMGLG